MDLVVRDPVLLAHRPGIPPHAGSDHRRLFRSPLLALGRRVVRRGCGAAAGGYPRHHAQGRRRHDHRRERRRHRRGYSYHHDHRPVHPLRRRRWTHRRDHHRLRPGDHGRRSFLSSPAVRPRCRRRDVGVAPDHRQSGDVRPRNRRRHHRLLRRRGGAQRAGGKLHPAPLDGGLGSRPHRDGRSRRFHLRQHAETDLHGGVDVHRFVRHRPVSRDDERRRDRSGLRAHGSRLAAAGGPRAWGSSWRRCSPR